MIKKQKKLEPGDIIRVEYGDFDNWVIVMIDRVENNPKQYCDCKLECHYRDGRAITMYGKGNDEVEVLGKNEF